MEAMKAIAEVHSKSQMAGGPAADPASPVITQQPNDADGEAGMEDINLTIEDGETAELETKPGDSSSDAIELKDMLNNSRDDSGISGDVLTTDLGQFDDDHDPYSNLHSETIDLKSDNDIQPNAETELEQTCDTQNSQTEQLPEVHQPIPEIVNSEHSGDTNIAEDINIADDTKTEDDTVDGSVKPGETIKVDDNTIKSDDNTTKADDNTTKVDDNTTKADENTTKADDNTIKADDNTIAEEQLNQNIKGYEVEATVEIPPDRKLEEVASITSEGSEVTPMTTGSEPQPASLDIDLSLDGISTCSFDPEAEVADVRSSGDGKVDQVSLVDVKVEVKDEMALLSKAIAEVQLEDGKLFEAKVKYQRELREARLKLYRMYKTYRQAIEKTKPYYVAKELEKEMKAELDQTETDAERAKLNFEAAKETEAIAMDAMSNTKAELGSIGQGSEGREAMDNWNQATARVLQTSKLRAEIEDRLRRKEEQFLQAERSANALFLDLKKFIEKAWPYYAMKDQYTRTLEKTRREIRESGQKLAAAKEKYQETFSRLNLVATEIHQKKTITDRQSGRRANDNFSQFEEIHDIDTVLSSLESRAENLSTCLDGLDDDEEGDIEAELTIMPKSKSLFSMGRSNTRESMDEILDAKKVLGEKGRRKTLAQINF